MKVAPENLTKRTARNMDNNTRTLLELGQECQAWRVNRGVSQAQVGRITGYSRSEISLFEMGHINNLLLYFFYRDNFGPINTKEG